MSTIGRILSEGVTVLLGNIILHPGEIVGRRCTRKEPREIDKSMEISMIWLVVFRRRCSV